MNDSGQAVAALCSFYKAGPDRVIAVHDELDLPFGSLRLKFGGGDNGHKDPGPSPHFSRGPEFARCRGRTSNKMVL